MLYQHMPHYQLLRRCEHFKVRTYIPVAENIKIHMFYHTVRIKGASVSDNTAKERHLFGVRLLYNMCPINAQNKTAIKPIFFLAQQPPVRQGLLIHVVSRSHTTTHHSRQDSSG